MGAVFEAVHEAISRRVAIKVLHPEAGRSTESINRFINEARAANLIGHPGLVQITDFGNLPDGSGYLVMEYLRGQTLSQRLEESGGKLPPSDAVQVSIQIASALATAHKKSIIHRDLKPSNVMLVPDPAMPTGERVKILDFGLAKLAAVQEAAMVKTNSQAVLGTPLYMSPEQCQGAGQVDAKTDVYSLGCMLYEMLSGRPPFLGAGPGEVIGKHLFKEPEPLAKVAPEVPPALATLVDRLLVKSRDERPTMRDARHELESLAPTLPPPQRRDDAEGSGVLDASKVDAAVDSASTQISAPAGPMSTLGQGAAESKQAAAPRRRTLLLVVGGVTLLCLAGSVLFLRSGRTRPPATAAAAATKSDTSPPRPIQQHIESEPAGADVLSTPGGTLLGKTPWHREQKAASGTEQITLRLSGYVEETLTLDLGANTQQRVKMRPVVAAPGASPPGLAQQPKPTLGKKAGRSPVGRPPAKVAASPAAPAEKPHPVPAVSPPPVSERPAPTPTPPSKKAVHERPKVEE